MSRSAFVVLSLLLSLAALPSMAIQAVPLDATAQGGVAPAHVAQPLPLRPQLRPGSWDKAPPAASSDAFAVALGRIGALLDCLDEVGKAACPD